MARVSSEGALMRMRRGMGIGVVAGGGAVTTMLVGLVTNAVSDQSRWPSWFGWMQRHPRLSFVMLGAVLVGLTVLLAALSDVGAPENGPGPLVRPDDSSRPPGVVLVLRSLPRDAATSSTGPRSLSG